MAIVTGDRYLDFLVKFVEKQADLLLEGTLVLKLNPVGLHYVQSRLEALQELEGLIAGAPVDYLRAYISDLGDHRALEQLRRILRLLSSLKVVAVLPPPTRDPTPLSLLPFCRLRVLELRGCDLSTSAARGLLELRRTLEKLICHNSTDALRHVFASRIVDIKDSPMWNRLSVVSCACNGLVLMDESLQLLPVVETLDLSRNRFAKVDNLQKCTKLRHLDLGFNHLRSVTSFSEVSGSIVKLVLRNNALTTLCGIENLKSVQGLDISYNIISSFSELEILAGLPSLQSLWLEGNPICCARWYRAQVFSFFTYPEDLKLDEKGINTKESWKRQIILASRQTRPAGFGFYSPAKDDPEGEGSVNTKRKKLSRLACIEDEQQKRSVISEEVEQESISCDGDIRSREENVLSDGEAEIVSLMNRVEYMKKEQSVLWLWEFKKWMDQTSGDIPDSSKFTGLISLDNESYLKHKISHRHLGESSRYVSEVRASGDETSTNILESGNSLEDGLYAQQYFSSIGEAASESMVKCSRETAPILEVGEMDLTQDQLKYDSQEQLNCLPVAKNHVLPGALRVQGGNMIDQKVNTMPLTVIDEIIGSHSSSAYPGSPPHYREDILHRRHNLEEEIMQLSAESYSLASSDSFTSSSDDFCKVDSSLPEVDKILDENCVNKIMDDNTEVFLFDSDWDNSNGTPHIRQNCNSLFDSCADQTSRIVDHALQFYADDALVAAAADCDIDHAISQQMGYLEKRKGKRKLKKRIISLSEENYIVGSTKPLSQKQNGISEVSIDDVKYGSESGNDFQNPNKVFGKKQLWINDAFKTPFEGCSDSLLLIESTDNHIVTDEFIKNYFHSNVANSSVSEICLQCMLCNCIHQEESEYRESEVAILQSSENKLYFLLVDATSDGSGIILEVIGCHRLEDIELVVVGLGLQFLRLYIRTDATYLFITRTFEKSRELLSLLQVCDSSTINGSCSLKSLEQVQVESFKEHICGGLKMSIFLYSMLLFWSNNCEEKSWLSRSMFVIGGYVFVCVEDIIQLSSVTMDDTMSSPYFLLDSCCSISNISEMVIEPRESRCVTLTVDRVTSERFNSLADLEKGNTVAGLEEKMTTGSYTWRLKWFSEETLLKFVAVLKALHAGTIMSPLRVRYIS